MTTEIGTKNKTIKYINIHKEGTTSEDTIDVDNRWTTPILEKQSDYLVAISRFEVPLNRVPVTMQMKNCIEIFRYNMTKDDIAQLKNESGHKVNVEDKYPTTEAATAWLNQLETYTEDDNKEHPVFNMCTGLGSHSIDMEPCHTIYEFVTKLNAQIKEVLLMNNDNKVIAPANNGDIQRYTDLNFANLFQSSSGNVVNFTEPIATFEIHMCADYTFEVRMNHAFAEGYYVKFSKALFNMLQFKEIESKEFDRMNLPGRRFMGSRTINIANLQALQMSKPAYVRTQRVILSQREVTVGIKFQNPTGESSQTVQHLESNKHRTLDLGQILLSEFQCTFSAPISAADTINRIKSLQFSSSLPTSSEGATGGTYRRLLTDFVIPVNTSFSWNTDTLVASSITENAASEYNYTNANPSSGRLLMMLDPSPLYELKLSVRAKCWDFEHERFVSEEIPLPAGATFTCKLVFISRNEIQERQRPDKMLPH